MDVSECLQNLRIDGNELCSQFGRYMSPAYHHDKCERCVHMRLYSMHKAEITVVYAIFAVLSLLAVIIGLSGPPIEYIHVYDVIESGATVLSTNATSSTHELITNGGPFVYITPALTRYNKQFWLFIVLHTENSDDEIYSESMLTSMSCAGITITKTANSVETINTNEVAKTQFYIYENEQHKNRTRYIWCKKRTCEPLRIAHLSFIKFTRYRFQIQFQNFESFHRKYNVQHVTFMLKSYSSDFTQMEMSFRIMYVVTTVFSTLWFCNSLRKYVISDWSYEQKWSVILLIFLLFYNGPAYSLTTIVDHWLIGFIDGVSQVTFLAALALFNLCIYHALRQNERRFLSFYLEKVIIVFILWSLSTIVVYYHRVHEYEDFSFSFELDSRVYQQKIVRWWLVFAAIYIALLLLSMLKAYTDLRTMPFFDKRLKFATTNVIVIMAIIWVTYNFNYGITGIIEDIYVANGISQTHSTSTVFMVIYAFLNFYTYLIVYVYSPAQKSIYENVVMKDNPAFSMIHDSEDEDATTVPMTSVYTKSKSSKAVTNNTSLLYSSDEEENHRNIQCPFNGRTDDSD